MGGVRGGRVRADGAVSSPTPSAEGGSEAAGWGAAGWGGVCVRRAVRLTAQLLAVTDVHLDASELLGEVRQAAHHVAVTRADLAERTAHLRRNNAVAAAAGKRSRRPGARVCYRCQPQAAANS